MGQAEKTPFDRTEEHQEVFNHAVDKLIERGDEQQSELGVSQQFIDQLSSSEELAGETEEELKQIARCNEAMEQLSHAYIENLSAFKENPLSLESLSSLEKAEEIWQHNAATILSFDKNGQEKQFLMMLRLEALKVIEDQLENASRLLYQNPSHELRALVLGIIATIDSILSEIGHPKDSEQRRRLFAIASNLAKTC